MSASEAVMAAVSRVNINFVSCFREDLQDFKNQRLQETKNLNGILCGFVVVVVVVVIFKTSVN